MFWRSLSQRAPQTQTTDFDQRLFGVTFGIKRKKIGRSLITEQSQGKHWTDVCIHGSQKINTNKSGHPMTPLSLTFQTVHEIISTDQVLNGLDLISLCFLHVCTVQQRCDDTSLTNVLIKHPHYFRMTNMTPDLSFCLSICESWTGSCAVWNSSFYSVVTFLCMKWMKLDHKQSRTGEQNGVCLGSVKYVNDELKWRSSGLKEYSVTRVWWIQLVRAKRLQIRIFKRSCTKTIVLWNKGAFKVLYEAKLISSWLW